MTYTFSLISSSFLPKKFSNQLREIIDTKKTPSTSTYNSFMHELFSILKQNAQLKDSSLYKQEIVPISKNKPLTEKTTWGGVSLKKVDVAKDFIQKLLVIQQFGVLGFEIHKQKLEKLKILDGACLVFYSNHAAKNWEKGKVSVKAAKKGDSFVFQPGDEHGILTLSDCVIEETSTNHLDDLVYIFPAEQVT